jgi:hypothetical protein
VSEFKNPAIAALTKRINPKLIWGQALLRNTDESRFELRHVEDTNAEAESLGQAQLDDLRSLAETNALGQFRPIKTAPNLRSGWLCVVNGLAELETALRHLYPGSVADWYATELGQAQPTDYRKFTERQTGMYRITAKLTPKQAKPAAAACCHPASCLKQRRWTVDDLAADDSGAKSAIPCLEPCALMLEFARGVFRFEQHNGTIDEMTEEDQRNLLLAAELAAEQAGTPNREADFAAPANPRWMRYLRMRLS